MRRSASPGGANSSGSLLFLELFQTLLPLPSVLLFSSSSSLPFSPVSFFISIKAIVFEATLCEGRLAPPSARKWETSSSLPRCSPSPAPRVPAPSPPQRSRPSPSAQRSGRCTNARPQAEHPRRRSEPLHDRRGTPPPPAQSEPRFLLTSHPATPSPLAGGRQAPAGTGSVCPGGKRRAPQPHPWLCPLPGAGG